MISHDAPGEVFDLGDLECRMESVLDVFDGLSSVAPRRVREYVRTIRRALRVERLQCREHRRVQGDCMWPAALGPWNPNDAVQKVHVVPPQVKEAPRRRPVCTERMIFSARNSDVLTDFAASMSRLYSSSRR